MSTYTHAGGVVTRTVHGRREYLIVESSKVPGEWVLPKGHIESGETAQAAAIREVAEEAGVRATIVAPAGDGEYVRKGKTVRTIYFLMQFQEETTRSEPRGLEWRQIDDAITLLSFDDTRRVLERACAISSDLRT